MSLAARRLRPNDWSTWRAARLTALADAPHAFGSSLEKEQAYDEGEWRAWLEPGKGLKVVVGDTAGIVGAWIPDGRDGAAKLFSMWVAPQWRGRGVGDLLVGEVLEWARESRCKRVDLWVVEGNEAATRLYERHGFRVTDEYQPHPNDACVCERAMTRDLLE